MATRRINPLPGSLPHAKLYLDDIEEVSEILLGAYVPRLAVRGQESEKPTVTYVLGNLRMDDIADLLSHGGSTSKLEILVGDYMGLRIALRGFLNPEIRLYSLNEKDAWAVYSEVRSIFERHPYRVKNAILGLPPFLQFLLYAITVVVPAAFLVIVPSDLQKSVAISVVTIWVAVMCIAGAILYRPSRAVFVRSHERSKESSEIRRKYIRDLIFLMLGAAGTKLVDLIVARLSR